MPSPRAASRVALASLPAAIRPCGAPEQSTVGPPDACGHASRPGPVSSNWPRSLRRVSADDDKWSSASFPLPVSQAMTPAVYRRRRGRLAGTICSESGVRSTMVAKSVLKWHGLIARPWRDPRHRPRVGTQASGVPSEESRCTAKVRALVAWASEQARASHLRACTMSCAWHRSSPRICVQSLFHAACRQAGGRQA